VTQNSGRSEVINPIEGDVSELELNPIRYFVLLPLKTDLDRLEIIELMQHNPVVESVFTIAESRNLLIAILAPDEYEMNAFLKFLKSIKSVGPVTVWQVEEA